MRTLLLAAVAALASVPAQAAVNTPVPSDNYITVNGLDWAWASPCAATGSGSCGTVDFSYQGSQGWRIPTLEEFLARPEYTAFGSKCASAYFSQYNHCDFGDGAAGYIFDYGYGVLPNGSSVYSDSWVVRSESAVPGGVPEAATWAMMIAGFGMVGASLRRRSAVTA